MPKILFVTHECSGTGAPILFINIINYLVQTGRYSKVDILGLKPGEKISEFSRLGNLFLCSDERGIEEVASTKLQKGYDYIYTNTVETAHVLPALFESGALADTTRVVSHVHELDGTIIKYGKERLEEFIKYSHAIICVSKAVCDNLLKYGFSRELIRVVYPFIKPLRQMDPKGDDSVFRVLGCGEITVCKGIDVFIETARKVLKKKEGVEFMWLGSDSYKIRGYFEEDIRKFGLDPKIRFVGYKEDISQYFYDADLFYLSSRQDSFPLVCLEAASIGLPSLYYPDAGGIKELFGTEAGFALPYLDTDYAANLIVELTEDNEVLRKVGGRARERYKNLLSESVALSEIEKIVSGNPDGLQ